MAHVSDDKSHLGIVLKVSNHRNLGDRHKKTQGINYTYIGIKKEIPVLGTKGLSVIPSIPNQAPLYGNYEVFQFFSRKVSVLIRPFCSQIIRSRSRQHHHEVSNLGTRSLEGPTMS